MEFPVEAQRNSAASRVRLAVLAAWSLLCIAVAVIFGLVLGWIAGWDFGVQ